MLEWRSIHFRIIQVFLDFSISSSLVSVPVFWCMCVYFNQAGGTGVIAGKNSKDPPVIIWERHRSSQWCHVPAAHPMQMSQTAMDTLRCGCWIPPQTASRAFQQLQRHFQHNETDFIYCSVLVDHNCDWSSVTASHLGACVKEAAFYLCKSVSESLLFLPRIWSTVGMVFFSLYFTIKLVWCKGWFPGHWHKRCFSTMMLSLAWATGIGLYFWKATWVALKVTSSGMVASSHNACYWEALWEMVSLSNHSVMTGSNQNAGVGSSHPKRCLALSEIPCVSVGLHKMPSDMKWVLRDVYTLLALQQKEHSTASPLHDHSTASPLHEPALFWCLNPPPGFAFSCHTSDSVQISETWSVPGAAPEPRCCVSSVTSLSPASSCPFASGLYQWSEHPE